MHQGIEGTSDFNDTWGNSLVRLVRHALVSLMEWPDEVKTDVRWHVLIWLPLLYHKNIIYIIL